MFGLFRRKFPQSPPKKPTLKAEDKKWVEESLLWFIECFGLERIRKEPFILPTRENFPYDNFKNPDQFRQLFEQLCNRWELDPEEIKINFFDDIQSKQWSNLAPSGWIQETAGQYYQERTFDKQRFILRLGKSNLDKPQMLTAVLSHELAHVKLIGGNLIQYNMPGMEPFTDLATIYFGFGIFLANVCENKEGGWLGRSGCLANEVISYSNALLCHISGKDALDYDPYLNTNTGALFLHDFAWLKHTNDTLLTKRKLDESSAWYEGWKEMNESFKDKKFNDSISAGHKLLETFPRHSAVLNYIGYALLMQKKYEFAINAFTQSIEADPYYDYPYNNRGYCRLQLGDLQNAYIDLHSSFEMNPDNSFSWRNLGAYYLATEEYQSALEYFEQAYKIDPKTELIHFYLGHAHAKLGNAEKAKEYFNTSSELQEYNDSLLKHESMITLSRTSSNDPAFLDLIVLLDKDLQIRDGDDHAYYSQYNKLDNIKHVVVAYVDNKPAGCGAFKEYSTDTAEIKRMFVLPEFRGKGIAKRLLAELESWATELNYSAFLLETGINQPEAISLYHKCGYTNIPNYDQYEGVVTSVCMKKVK